MLIGALRSALDAFEEYIQQHTRRNMKPHSTPTTGEKGEREEGEREWGETDWEGEEVEEGAG